MWCITVYIAGKAGATRAQPQSCTIHAQQAQLSYSVHKQETRMSGEVRRTPRLLEQMLAQVRASDF